MGNMTRPLEGRRVALAEGRQLEELVLLLEKEGVLPIRCPMVSILDNPDSAPVLDWLRDLTADRFGWLILMTGEALRRLLGFAEREGIRDAVVAALGKTRIVTRGPKPGQALRELGLAPTRIAEAPTTAGVIATLRKEVLTGQTVGLTLYGEQNPAMEEYLVSAGAMVQPVLPYVYAPAADAHRVTELIGQMAGGEAAAIIFTSSAQVDRIFEVAGLHGLEETLRQGLVKARVAAVGPVVAAKLHDKGVAVAVCPEQGWVMKNLVAQLRKAMEREVGT
jgi:uroporphyrinogen-III synthase